MSKVTSSTSVLEGLKVGVIWGKAASHECKCRAFLLFSMGFCASQVQGRRRLAENAEKVVGVEPRFHGWFLDGVEVRVN